MRTVVLVISIAFNIGHVFGPSPPIVDRIEALKRQLLAQDKLNNYSALYSDEYSEDTERDFKIYPIKVDLKKRWQMSKGKKSKPNNSSKVERLESPVLLQPTGRRQSSSMDFYRRLIGEEIMDQELKWLHCQVIVTPYLTGLKKGPTDLTRIGSKDPIPERLFHLLNVNTSLYSKDDIFALVIQISELQLRFYHWDLQPMRILINMVVKGKPHTFHNLKQGVQDMFKNWRVEIGNKTTIIKYTYMIRPPCTVSSTYSDHTKSQKLSRYKDLKSTTPKKSHCIPAKNKDC